MPSMHHCGLRRRTGWVLAVLLLGLALGGCAQHPPHAIRFGLGAAPVTLDPRYATDAVSYRICRLLYRSLVDFDNHFRPVPELATWKKLSPLHYVFTLGSKGRRFDDGSWLTSADVKATYDYVLAPEHASPARGSLSNIERIEAPDPNHVAFFLKRPDPLFPGRLTIGILPARLIADGHDFNADPVGSGPMRFVSWPSAGDLTLQRIADGLRIEFLTVPDPTVRVLKLLRGELDLFQGEVPQELIRWLERRHEAVVERSRGTTFTYLGFNLRDPVVGRRDLREAIAYALNRKAIIRYVMGGAARKANALLPPNHWAGAPHLHGYDYDPAKARALVRKAGFDAAHPPRFTYKTSNDPFRVRLATIIQNELRKVGIYVDVRSYDWGTFYGDIKAGRFQMYSLSWVGLKMPDIFRYAFYSKAVPPNGANRGHYSSPEADRLIEEAEDTPDLKRQAELYRRLQALLLHDLPYVPLWYEDNILVRRRSIKGYTLAPDGNYDGLIHVERSRP